MRPSRETLHMCKALLWAERSVCKRYSVGCVVTDHSMKKILGFGYNGPPPEAPHEQCTNVEGGCGCVHAEMNAIVRNNLMVDGKFHKVLFTTCAPCFTCAEALIRSAVTKVVYLKDYRDQSGLDLFRRYNFEVVQFPATEVSALLEELTLSKLLQKYLSIPRENT